MKKRIALLLSCLICVALFACSQENPVGPGKLNSQTQNGTDDVVETFDPPGGPEDFPG